MDNKKISQKSDIPTKVFLLIINENDVIFAECIYSTINGSMKVSKFPLCLKVENIIPIHKKEKIKRKENYRPVSILCALSKICWCGHMISIKTKSWEVSC